MWNSRNSKYDTYENCHPSGVSMNEKNSFGVPKSEAPDYKSQINSNMGHVTLKLLTDLYPEFSGVTCRNLPLHEIRTDQYHSKTLKSRNPDFFLEKKKRRARSYPDYYQGGRNMLHPRYGYERKFIAPKKWKIAHGQIHGSGIRNKVPMQISDTELIRRSLETNFSEQESFVSNFGHENEFLIHDI